MAALPHLIALVGVGENAQTGALELFHRAQGLESAEHADDARPGEGDPLPVEPLGLAAELLGVAARDAGDVQGHDEKGAVVQTRGGLPGPGGCAVRVFLEGGETEGGQTLAQRP